MSVENNFLQLISNIPLTGPGNFIALLHDPIWLENNRNLGKNDYSTVFNCIQQS